MPNLQPTSALASGPMRMPIIGLGTWMASRVEIEEMLKWAIDVGYRHIDTAFAYMNEEVIGQSLKQIFQEGKVKREDLFITTKLPHIALRAEYVEEYIKKSLEALQLEYVDLYLIHMPCGFVNRNGEFFPRNENGKLELDLKINHLDLWKAMEAEVDAGRAKSIGLSNFNLRQVQRLVENSRIPPANNQVELHIYHQQSELVSYCRDHNVSICAYAPLGSKSLGDFAKIIGGPDRPTDSSPMEDPVIIEIAKTHGKTPAQVLLRFLIEYGVAVIPKSSNAARIKENFDIFDFGLSKEEFEQIRSLDRGTDGSLFAGRNDFYRALAEHPEYPF